jgi:hypothetical protein
MEMEQDDLVDAVLVMAREEARYRGRARVTKISGTLNVFLLFDYASCFGEVISVC